MTEQYRPDRLQEQARLQAYLDELPQEQLGPILFQYSEGISGRGMGLHEVIQDHANRTDASPAVLEKHTQFIEDYQRFAAVADAIPDGPPNPAALPEGVSYLDSGWFNYAYLYVDNSGGKHVIKIPKGHDFVSRTITFMGTAIALARSEGNDALEQIEGISPSNRLRIITRYEDGPWFATLSTEELAQIPREHIRKLGDDLKDSARRNVVADMHGEGNLRYNPEKGFILLDPHNAAEYKVGDFQNTNNVRNILLHLLRNADEASPENNAVRLRIAKELLESTGPDFADPSYMDEIMYNFRLLAGDAVPPPWPASYTNQPELPSSASDTTTNKTSGASAGGEPSAIMRTGMTVAGQIDALPIGRLQQAAVHLAATLEISASVGISMEAGIHEPILGGQQHLEQAITALTSAREAFNTYLASIGLGSLVRRIE